MKATDINIDIVSDIRKRYNNFKELTPIKFPKNAKCCVSYSNRKHNVSYFVGLWNRQGKTVRILAFPIQQSFFTF